MIATELFNEQISSGKYDTTDDTMILFYMVRKTASESADSKEISIRVEKVKHPRYSDVVVEDNLKFSHMHNNVPVFEVIE